MRFLSILLILQSAASAALAMYEGKFYLTEVFDSQDEPVQLPLGRFDLEVTPPAESETRRYKFSLKVGNYFGGSFVVDQNDDTKIKLGPMRSTMMMPPQDVYALENRLGKMLPACTTIDLQGDKLEFRGSEGRVTFKKETE
jgi:hypothetical protein